MVRRFVAVMLLVAAGCSARCNLGPGRAPEVEIRRQEAPPATAGTRPPDRPGTQPPPAAPIAPAAAPTTAPPPVPPAVAPPAAPVPEPALPSEPLAIEVEGRPLRFRSAFAFTRAGRALFVWFTTERRRGCPASFSTSARGEQKVYVLLFPLLPAEGAGWRAGSSGAFMSPGLVTPSIGSPRSFPGAIDREPSAVGDAIRGALDVRTDAITLRGRFEATYCGDEPGLPPPASFPDIRARVGGESIPVRGARVLLQDDLVRLELSSGGSDCAPLSSGADVEIEVRRYGDRQTEIYLSGHRLTTDRSLGLGGAGLQERITLDFDAPPTPGTTVGAHVGFDGEVRGLPVALSGDVRAHVCPRL
jgi:hypothetical protein